MEVQGLRTVLQHHTLEGSQWLIHNLPERIRSDSAFNPNKTFDVWPSPILVNGLKEPEPLTE